MAEQTDKPDTPEVTDKPDAPERDAPKGLTQAEVDNIVESRLARERKKYEGFDDLKAKADRLDEIERENQSDLERERADKEAEKARADKLAEDNREIVARSSLLQEIAKPSNKIVDPEGAVEFLLGADRDLLTFDDSGTPTNIPEALEKLTEKRGYLVTTGESPVSDADLGARGGSKAKQLSESDLANMTPQEIVTARNEGRLDDVLSGK